MEKGRARPILKESFWKSINPLPRHNCRKEARAGKRFFSHVRMKGGEERKRKKG